MLFRSLFSFALSACGPVKDFKDQLTERIVGQDPIDPPADLKDIKAKLNPKILWSSKLGGNETFEFSPGIIGDEAYAASADGSLVKIDLKTGKMIWKIHHNSSIMAHYAPFSTHSLGSTSVYPHAMTPMQTSMRPGRYDISVHEDGDTIRSEEHTSELQVTSLSRMPSSA